MNLHLGGLLWPSLHGNRCTGRKKKSHGSLNDAISAAYVKQSLEPGCLVMISVSRV